MRACNSTLVLGGSALLAVCIASLISGCGDTVTTPGSDGAGGFGGVSDAGMDAEGPDGTTASPEDADTEGSGGNENQSSSGGASGSGGEPNCELDEDGACLCPHGQVWDDYAEECSPTGSCPEGEGWDATEQQCFRCVPAFGCSGDGETGRLLATTSAHDGACICETRPGYFPSADGSIAELCDADGDGWVNDRAQPQIESESSVIRENARCDLHTVAAIVLENEQGKSFVAEDLTLAFAAQEALGLPAGLPLYESARNDTKQGSTLPEYKSADGGRRLYGRELNSLTRGCISATADLNDNGMSDVSEAQNGELLGRSFATKRLKSYYEKYKEYSYFFELHSGSYHAATTKDVASYRISERPRVGGGVRAIGVGYPQGASDYLQSCDRHLDALYAWSAEGELSAPNLAGGDFVRFGEAAGMFHHSQYKCVQVVSSAGYEATTDPQRVHLETDGDAYSVLRQTAAGAVNLPWTLNRCHASGIVEGSSAGAAAVAQIECLVAASPPAPGSVRWAAVGYQHYTTPYVSAHDPGGYQRSCVNQCAEGAGAVNECYGCSAETSGESLPKPLGTACSSGSCNGEGVCDACLPGTTQCKDSVTQQLCTNEREWEDNVDCQYGCANGACYPDCAPGTRTCSAGTPQLCDDTGHWTPLASCQDGRVCTGAGECLLPDGAVCSTAADCASDVCKRYYTDADGDTYGAGATYRCGDSAPSGTATRSGDCCDSDKNARPGQSGYFGSARKGCGGYDYNCDDEIERASSASIFSCPAMPDCSGDQGWLTGVPNCGKSGTWGVCVPSSMGCHPFNGGQKVQGCR